MTNEVMVVDISDRDWQMSLALMADAILAVENVGLILVPVAPHQGMRWLNGRVPGVTTAVVLVPAESVQAIQDACERMATILTGGEL